MPASFSIVDYVNAHLDPQVPAELARYTCGPDQSHFDFVRSGAEVYLMLDMTARKYGGRGLDDHPAILDFGCGNGRILRFIDPARCSLSGCDISAENIDFSGRHFGHVSLHVNGLLPPLKYPDNSFDLIYAFSVFSHLSLDVENVWLRELVRVGKPGCLFLISVHGDWVIEATLGASARAVSQAGFFWKQTHGPDSKFPEYYEVSYHSSAYIRQYWSQYFDILDVVKGDDPMRYVAHPSDLDMAAMARQLRPMGQDLVVARSRT